MAEQAHLGLPLAVDLEPNSAAPVALHWPMEVRSVELQHVAAVLRGEELLLSSGAEPAALAR
jgi:hypothetical protein